MEKTAMNFEKTNDLTMNSSSSVEEYHASPIAQKSCEEIGKDSPSNRLSNYITSVASSDNPALTKTTNDMETSLHLDTSHSPSLHFGDDDDDDSEDDAQEGTNNDEQSPYNEESIEVEAMDEQAAGNVAEQSDKKEDDAVVHSSLIRSSQLSSVALDESLNSIASQDANAVSDDTGPFLGYAVSLLSPILQRRDSEVVEARGTPADDQAENTVFIEAVTAEETNDPIADIESHKNEQSYDGSSLAEEGEIIEGVCTESESSREDKSAVSPPVSTSSQNDVCSSETSMSSPCAESSSGVVEDECAKTGNVEAAEEQALGKQDGASTSFLGAADEPAEKDEPMPEENSTMSTFEAEETHSESLQEQSRSFVSHHDCSQTGDVESFDETADNEKASESADLNADGSSRNQGTLTNETDSEKPTDTYHSYSVDGSNRVQEQKGGLRSDTDGDTESVAATVSSWNETKSLDGRERIKHGGSPMPQNYNDLTSAKKHLNESSRAFTESLRDAAHRRKMKMTRSRDSLAAKEKQHLISLESEKQRAALAQAEASSRRASVASRPQQESIDPYKPFKARPVPLTTGNLGTGGQAGVPKVEKKQTTTPFSPLLGPRRKQQPNNAVRSKQQTASRAASGSHVPFKARPAPRTTGAAGHGGQAGIPKIPKRQSTVPESPQLGLKRRSMGATTNSIHTAKPAATRSLSASAQQTATKNILPNAGPPLRLRAGREASEAKQRALEEKRRAEELELQKQRQFRARPLPRMKTPAVSKASASSPALRGLDILGNENSPQATAQTPRFSNVRPYEPHSTVRAKKRAEFDEELSRVERQRSKEQQVRRRTLLEQKRAEVDSLRPKLR